MRFRRKTVGAPLTVWTGYTPSSARLSNNDKIDWPVLPWKHGPDAFANVGMIQLNNGWEMTNWGRRQTYQNYLSELSMSKPFKPNPVLPGQRQQPTAYAPPSQAALMNYQLMTTNNSMTSNTGRIAPGVNLSGRSFN